MPVSRALFSGLSVVTFFFLIYAGHHGANLTHGNDYLTLETLLHQEREKPVQVEDAFIFEDVVQPILENRCIQCHRRSKKKGQLSLESLASIVKGGKHGPAVVPGNLTKSELFRRITLDPSHDDFMPADGKPPMTKTETEIVRWWIENGKAAEEKTISELKDREEIILLAASFLGLDGGGAGEMSAIPGQKVNVHIPDTLDMAWVENLRKNGLIVRLMLRKPVMLDVTLPPDSGKKMSDMANDFKHVAKNMTWLNLSDNDFTENDLEILKHMVNLEKLRLQKNPVSDGISRYLAGLQYLEAVNLNETKISMACVSRLRMNPAIKRIYTWRTKCDTSFYFQQR